VDIKPDDVDIDLMTIETTRDYSKVKLELHKKVKECIETAASQIKLDNQMNQLLNELISPVDPVVKRLFQHNISDRYYEILRDYYCENPAKINEIKIFDKVDILENWNYQTIMTLLLHEWMFVSGGEEIIKMFPTFLRILHKLFWLDLNDEHYRFLPIFEFFYNKVLLSTQYWKGSVPRVLPEVFNLVTKFYFYYHGNKETLEQELFHFLVFTHEEFNKIKSSLELPEGHQKVHTQNMFTNELVRHMGNIKNEHVLLQYLENCKILKNQKLGKKTSIRFQRLLIDFMTPGLPFYPTRIVRDKAKICLDVLFPSGKRMRSAINLVFRLFNPISTVTSWAYHIKKNVYDFWSLIIHTIMYFVMFILQKIKLL